MNINFVRVNQSRIITFSVRRHEVLSSEIRDKKRPQVEGSFDNQKLGEVKWLSFSLFPKIRHDFVCFCHSYSCW